MLEPSIIKVLLVEDDEDDYLITRDILAEIDGRQYDLQWVNDFDLAREQIHKQQHDVYLVDFRLGPHNGLELLKEAVINNCPAPIILLTGLGTPDIDREAMNAGAADYLIKGQITPDLLARSINHSIQRKKTEWKLRKSEERLRQAQKLEAIGTLAGGIAHDFNNILAIISGYAGRIRKDQSPGAITQSVEAIEQTVQRGAALVRQILTFARKTEFALEHANVNGLLRELVHMLKETFPKTIRFDLHLDERVRPLLGDVSQLHQTFLNLCVNARDAMPNGGTISIATRALSIPSPRKERETLEFAEITVRDTGIGMDDETQRRIFEPFFTTKTREGGTGLGLAVVYGSIQHHGGTIEVESEPGKGTCFRILLPMAVEPREEAKENSAEIDPFSYQGTEQILFVEDEEILLELMKTVLEEQGYTVVPAKDGLEAVEIYRMKHDRIDLVVTDMGLPGIGGWEVLSQIREINPQAKVLLASGYLDPDLKGKMISAGARDLLQKPYVPSELLQRIRHAIDASSVPQQSAL